MTKLTRERIEHSKKEYWDGGYPGTLHEWNALHDMALESLDREGVVVPRAPSEQRLRDAIETLRKAMPSSERFVYLTEWQRINSALYDDAAAPQEGGKDKPC